MQVAQQLGVQDRRPIKDGIHVLAHLPRDIANGGHLGLSSQHETAGSYKLHRAPSDTKLVDSGGAPDVRGRGDCALSLHREGRGGVTQLIAGHTSEKRPKSFLLLEKHVLRPHVPDTSVDTLQKLSLHCRGR